MGTPGEWRADPTSEDGHASAESLRYAPTTQHIHAQPVPHSIAYAHCHDKGEPFAQSEAQAAKRRSQINERYSDDELSATTCHRAQLIVEATHIEPLARRASDDDRHMLHLRNRRSAAELHRHLELGEELL